MTFHRLSSSPSASSSLRLLRIVPFFLILSLKFLVLVSALENGVASSALPRYQSGPSVANTFAGGLVYDARKDAFYATGATYQKLDRTVSAASSCFLQLFSNTLEPLDERIYGVETVPEACTAIGLDDTSAIENVIVLAGSSEQGGFFTPPAPGMAIPQHGFVYSVRDVTETTSDWIGGIIDGTSIASSAVNYPVAIIVDGSNVYVASMTSSDTSITAEAASLGNNNEEMPNWTNSGIRKYGSSYSMTIQKYRSSAGRYVLQWSREYSTIEDASIADTTVYLGGMVLLGNELYVVGSTRGSGEAFGEGNGTEDGFITKLDSGTGDLVSSSAPSLASVARIGKNANNDIVTNICTDPSGHDPDTFYIVGATSTPEGNLFPMISKVSAVTLIQEWTLILEANHVIPDLSASAYALACQVPPATVGITTSAADGSAATIVYLAGEARDGTIVNGASAAYGDDDVFVVQVDIMSGQAVWVQQIGSAGKEVLSQGSGALSVDSAGNAVLFGHTNGRLFRDKTARTTSEGDMDSFTDLFAVTISKTDGSHPLPLDEPIHTTAETGGTTPTAPVSPPVAAPVTAPAAEPATDNTLDQDTSNRIPIVPIVVGAILVVCSCCVLCARARQRAADRSHQKQMISIFKYLNVFDVEDIDIQRSPVGGYHGTYLNDLANGNNPGDGTGAAAAVNKGRPNLAHKSVADDYMFMSKRRVPTETGHDSDDDNQSQTSQTSLSNML